MIVKAMYHKPKLNGYGGQAYTFRTNTRSSPVSMSSTVTRNAISFLLSFFT